LILIYNAVKELLDNLERVFDDHAEIGDTMTRECSNAVIFNKFVHAKQNYEIYPEFEMYSEEGNIRIQQALIHFFEHPDVQAVLATDSLTAEDRRIMFTHNHIISSKYGFGYDTFFGGMDEIG